MSILLVVTHHVALRIPLNKTALGAVLPRRFLDGLCYNGYESVFIFFVISGFLIAQNCIRRWGGLGRPDIADFYRRRFARIVPGLAVLVAVLTILDLLAVPYYTIAGPAQSLPRALLAVWGLHLNWYEGRTGYLPGGWDVLWSLSIEEAFYFGFPLVCLLLGRQPAVLAAAALALALSLPITHEALAGNEIWQEKAYLPGMAAIATGVLAAMAETRFSSWLSSRRHTLLALGMAGIASVLFAEDVLWTRLGDATLLILTFSTGFFLLAVSSSRQTFASGRLTWLRSAGKLSYEIYLTHMFIVFAAIRLYRGAGQDIYAGGGHDIMWGFVLFIPVLALACGLGWLFARGVTEPAEGWLRKRLGRRLDVRLDS